MSSLAAIWNRDGAPLGTSLLGRVLARLSHRGRDGFDFRMNGSLALGHAHFWTTPEENGERQPLADPDDRFQIVFDGRLDNREELLASLDLGGEAASRLSDAALVLCSYVRWGAGCLERLLGPFALVVHDGPARCLLCARDPVGDRTLFYHVADRFFVAASEEAAVLAHPQVPARLDEHTLALFCAVRTPVDGATFFEDVREIPPGHAMEVGPDRVRTWRYGSLDPEANVRYADDEQYAEHFLAVLTRAVRCRLRAVDPPAVMMSGGLDSTSVAAVAARELSGRDIPVRLRALSWIFDDLERCDERPFIEALVRRHGIDSRHIPGDDLWPLREVETWPVNPSSPEMNPYQRLKDAVYDAATKAGGRVILTGASGDHLYRGAEAWLIDLVRERGVMAAGAEILKGVRQGGIGGLRSDPGVRHLGGRLLALLPGMGRRRRNLGFRAPAWLTPSAVALLEETQEAASQARPRERRDAAFRARAARGVSGGAYHAARAGVELREPYRDRRLIQFALSIPAHQLSRWSRRKHVLRNAMRGVLPEEILARRDPTSLFPLYNRGLLEREKSVVQDLLEARDAIWPRYVRKEWVYEKALARGLPSQIDGVEAVVPWQCLSMEIWRRNAERSKAVWRFPGASRLATKEIVA